jgi:hypothetical protein
MKENTKEINMDTKNNVGNRMDEIWHKAEKEKYCNVNVSGEQYENEVKDNDVAIGNLTQIVIKQKGWKDAKLDRTEKLDDGSYRLIFCKLDIGGDLLK